MVYPSIAFSNISVKLCDSSTGSFYGKGICWKVFQIAVMNPSWGAFYSRDNITQPYWRPNMVEVAYMDTKENEADLVT